MDKFKEQLAVVKEHSFWILCGGVLLVSLISWYVSTGNLQTKQKQYKGEIESAVSTLNSVLQTADHPNDSTNKGMDVVMTSFGEDVYQAWLRLSENQERVLVWGGFFGSDEQFQREVRPLRPIEMKVGDAEVITTDSRNLYREYIDDQLPKLAEIIQGKWRADARSSGSKSGPGGGAPGGLGGGGLSSGGPGGGGAMPGIPGGGGAGAAKEDDASVVVVWNPTNQNEISEVHFSLAANEAIPGTLEVLYAQEDLWVFENLMNIIRETNKPATRRHEAAIKYIDYVRIGKSAGDVAGQVTLVGSNNSSGGGAGGPGGMPGPGGPGGGPGGPGGGPGGTGGGPSGPGGGPGGPGGSPGGPGGGPGGPGGPSGGPSGGPGGPGGGTPGGMPGPGGSGGRGSPSSLASGRYVDLSYASILDINRLRNAMKGQATKPEDMLLAVAKRMPVRMQFKMDQRRLTSLLAECGNSKLPVEVRQVRINRGTASSSGGASGMSGGIPGAGGGGGGLPGADGDMGGAPGGSAGMPGMGGGGRSSAKPASSIASSKEDPNEILVEIYGIVYIYNPPDRKLLGIPEPPGSTPPSTLPGPTTTPTSTTPSGTPPVPTGAVTGR